MKEPLRYTLLPPYGHTKRIGISTVPATPPASLAESMLELNIPPQNWNCYFEITLQPLCFIASCQLLQFVGSKFQLMQHQFNALPKKKKSPNQNPSKKKRKIWCFVSQKNRKRQVPISHCNIMKQAFELGTKIINPICMQQTPID